MRNLFMILMSVIAFQSSLAMAQQTILKTICESGNKYTEKAPLSCEADGAIIDSDSADHYLDENSGCLRGFNYEIKPTKIIVWGNCDGTFHVKVTCVSERCRINSQTSERMDWHRIFRGGYGFD